MSSGKIIQLVLRIVLFFAIVISGFLLMKYMGSLKKEMVPGSAPERTVYLAVKPYAETAIEGVLSYSGRVVSGQPVQLMTEVQGVVKVGDVPFKVGQSFRSGQLLFSVNDTEARLSVQASRSQLLTSIASILPDLQVDFPNAASTWQNYFSALDPKRPIPELPSISSPRLKTFLASRGIINQYYSIKSAEERLSKYEIYAPFSGSFTQVLVQPGGMVNPGQVAAVLTPSQNVEVEVPISKENAQWITVGENATILSTDGKATVKGRVVRKGNVLSGATQSVSVFVSVNGKADWLYEGAYFTVQFPAKDVEGFAINRSALVNNEAVYIVEDSTLQQKPITLLRKDAEEAIITGLDEGVSVVVKPAFNVYVGQRVIPVLEDSVQ